MSQPTREELIADYIKYTGDIAMQDLECAANGVIHDIARRAIALYGAADVAKALQQRFAINVENIAGGKQ